jgi:hypothetical protein
MANIVELEAAAEWIGRVVERLVLASYSET